MMPCRWMTPPQVCGEPATHWYEAVRGKIEICDAHTRLLLATWPTAPVEPLEGVNR